MMSSVVFGSTFGVYSTTLKYVNRVLLQQQFLGTRTIHRLQVNLSKLCKLSCVSSKTT